MGSLGLADLTPCLFWKRCPMILAVAEGQYLVALESVRPGHEEKFPALIAVNHVERTGYPAAAGK